MRCCTAFIVLFFYANLCAQPFQPDELGHVSGPGFPAFLRSNGIQLCGAFSVTHATDTTIHFAVIFKDDKVMYLESTGKIYPTYGEYLKATGIEEQIAQGFDTQNPFERNDEQDDAEAYEDPEWFKGNNTHTYEKKGKMGLVFNKKKVLPPVYDDIRQDLAHGQPVFIITKDGLEGIADTAGRIIVEPTYTHINGLFSNGRICYHVKDDDSEGFLDIAGNPSIPLQELKMSYKGSYILISEGLYRDRRYGIMDTTGNILLEPVYTYAAPVEDYRSEGPTIRYNAIIVETPGRGKGIVDFTGKLLLDTIYYAIEPFCEHVYRFTTAFGEDGLSGLFNMTTGQTILPAEYSFEQNYSDENDTIEISRRIGNNTLHGLMTKKGELLVPANYSYVYMLKHDKVLILGKGREYQLTDLQLQPVHTIVYEDLSPLKEEASHLPENRLLAWKGNKKGVIDPTGKVIIPLVYDGIYPDNHVLHAVQGQKNDFLDLRGNRLLTTQLTVLDCKIGYVYAKDKTGAYILYDLYGNSLKDPKSTLFNR